MNDSIVAMSGWIMPAPFAMPVTVTGTPSTVTRRDAPFGTVSVVMIAFAAANQPSARAAALRRGKRGDDPVDRQRLHDHAGRIRQHVLRRAIEKARDRHAFGMRVGEAGSPVPAFALPGVDDERAKAAAGACWRARCRGTR